MSQEATGVDLRGSTPFLSKEIKMRRHIDEHHDGFDLNKSIDIIADEPGPGGASHNYSLEIGENKVGSIQFQKGPRNIEGSTPGVTEGALLSILIDRLRSFQEGDYRCRENAIALTHLEEALMWVKQRTFNRAKRGVLGTNSK